MEISPISTTIVQYSEWKRSVRVSVFNEINGKLALRHAKKCLPLIAVFTLTVANFAVWMCELCSYFFRFFSRRMTQETDEEEEQQQQKWKKTTTKKKKPDWFISFGGWLLQRVILPGNECITYSQVKIHIEK